MNNAINEYLTVQKRLLASVWRIVSKTIKGGIILGMLFYIIALLGLSITQATGLTTYPTLTLPQLLWIAPLCFAISFMVMYLFVLVVMIYAIFKKP